MSLLPKARSRRGLSRWLLQTILVAVAAVGLLLCTASAAWAHAEMIEASPDRDDVAGGEFHSIRMQFVGLDVTDQHTFVLTDPAGNVVTDSWVQEGQKVVIPIEPLSEPGVYTVSFRTLGVDADTSDRSFSFTFDPDAPEPGPIEFTPDTPKTNGLDTLSWLLIALGTLIFAAIVINAIVQFKALREQRAVHAKWRDEELTRDAAESAHLDEVYEVENSLVRSNGSDPE